MKALLFIILFIPSLIWGDLYYKQIPQFLDDGFDIINYDSHTIERPSYTEIIEIFILQKKDQLVTCYNTTYKEPLSYVNGLDVKCYPHNNNGVKKID
jgi:hypothetical protein